MKKIAFLVFKILMIIFIFWITPLLIKFIIVATKYTDQICANNSEQIFDGIFIFLSGLLIIMGILSIIKNFLPNRKKDGFIEKYILQYIRFKNFVIFIFILLYLLWVNYLINNSLLALFCAA